MTTKSITLAGGCFWCLDAVYRNIKGIIKSECGYSNGKSANPTYQQVCQGDSGYVEVVQLTYDEENISLEKILEIFFVIHDPTTLNRQGNDVGTQYRSGIYSHDELGLAEVEKQIEKYLQSVKAKNANHHADNIVTERKLINNYYPAEAYHQNYFVQNPHQGYCSYVIAPKIAKSKKEFGDVTNN